MTTLYRVSKEGTLIEPNPVKAITLDLVKKLASVIEKDEEKREIVAVDDKKQEVFRLMPTERGLEAVMPFNAFLRLVGNAGRASALRREVQRLKGHQGEEEE